MNPKFASAALSGALPAHRVESGIELLACRGQRTADALAGTSEVEAVVAAVSRTSVKAHPAQGLGELGIFLTAIGTNHNNACSGYLRNAIIAHCGSPVIHPRAGFRARRIANILANDCFNIALSGQFPGGSRLSVFDRRGSITITMGAIRSRPRDQPRGTADWERLKRTADWQRLIGNDCRDRLPGTADFGYE